MAHTDTHAHAKWAHYVPRDVKKRARRKLRRVPVDSENLRQKPYKNRGYCCGHHGSDWRY